MSQEELLVKHFKTRKYITTWDAYSKYGITRLSAKIYNLKKAGYRFKDKFMTAKNRYGIVVNFKRYELVKGE